MALLPIPIRRRLRGSGFSEDQTDALDEASEATVGAAREAMARQDQVNDQFMALRSEIAALRADMNAMKWWLFGSLATLILAATAAILAAIAIWG